MLLLTSSDTHLTLGLGCEIGEGEGRNRENGWKIVFKANLGIVISLAEEYPIINLTLCIGSEPTYLVI